MKARTPQQLWETALGTLQVEVSRPSFNTWLRGTVGLRLSGNEFTIGVPNTFVAEFLEQNLRSLVERVLCDLLGYEVRATFSVGTAAGKPRPDLPDLPLLNPRYTFDSFVVGRSNELAHAAATRIVEQPGSLYNPLFIHGPAGVGKSHLLHAIGHAALTRGLQVRYTSAEQFTNELITAIREGTTEEFRRHYRQADILLVDDIQFFAGKEQTRENFFHTFNALHARGCQIALTSDTPPRDIPKIRERLRSRFEWGLVTDLQPPDFETRLAILRARAQQNGADLAPDVLEFIALQIKENIRVLEGALNRVLAYAQLMRSAITPEVAARALDNLATRVPRLPRPTPALINEAVAASFRIGLSDLKGRRRDDATVLARQVSMYLMRQETDASLAEIGRELGGRSPATVSHAFNRISNIINSDPHLRRQVFNIRQSILASTSPRGQ